MAQKKKAAPAAEDTKEQKTPAAPKTTGKKNAAGKAPARKAGTRGKNAKPSKRSELRAELKSVSGVDNTFELVRLIFAGVLFLVTIFLFVAFISNIFTGSADQGLAKSGEWFSADYQNYAGSLGAIISYKIMGGYFGIGSIMLPVFLTCVILKLMMKATSPVRLWVSFIHCTIIAVLLSIDITYIQNTYLPEDFLQNYSFELGGMHGREVIEFLTKSVGSTLTLIIILALTILYIGYWFTQILIWIAKGIRKIGSVIAQEEPEEDDVDEEGDDEEGTDDETEAADDEDDETADNENAEDDAEKEDVDSENGEQEELSEDNLGTAMELDLTITEMPTEEAEEATEEKPEDAAADKTAEDKTTEEGDTMDLVVTETVTEAEAGSKTVGGDLTRDLGPYDPKLDLERYKYPPIELLEKHTSNAMPTTKEELEANKNRIIQVLSNFDVKISSISATVGPTVTLYEITPAPGVRIAKIRNLEDDIALSLSALGIRIIAPIPGKGTIGIEVPNARPQVVSMESIINTQKFRETKYELPIALGKTITNEIFMVDLAKMPHLLVAGATGQGKSVGLNAIITSLLYKKHPSELKLVMVDPKKVEFSMYNPIVNHFLAQVPEAEEPVITDVKKVINTLKSLCVEMDERYDLLKTAMCKNIKEYNAKFCNRHLNPEKGHKYLPYIVVIIDEFGDLIMTAGKEIELPIARIAQLARAVGIHMIIATQSPRATIITGKIKANFPARMAFRVSQGVESQTILDRRGANNLIGRGDMLFQGGSELTRVQCAFVDTPEVEAISRFIAEQQGYSGPFELPLVADDGSDGMEGISSSDGSSTFEQVARYVVNNQMGSTSKIQRIFSIGFNRAGRLMDQLEEAGIVGPQMGSKPREVLVHSEMELNQILQAMKDAGQHFE